jgi:hypothetical protein
MKAKISSLGTRNLGLVVSGVVSLIIGLVTPYYQVTQLVGGGGFLMWWVIVYPYRNEGMILLDVAIILIALGFLLPLQKIEQPKNILTFDAEMGNSLS